VNGGFGGAAGVTIASGAGEGRLIAIGGERLCEDAAWGLSKFHAFPVRKLNRPPAQRRSVSGHLRRGLVVAGQSRDHGMDCRGFDANTIAEGLQRCERRSRHPGTPFNSKAGSSPISWRAWAPCRWCRPSVRSWRGWPLLHWHTGQSEPDQDTSGTLRGSREAESSFVSSDPRWYWR
jgi:hypothetical protein